MKRAILFLIILALVFPVMAACSSGTEEINIYFKDAQTNTLSIEKRKIEKSMSATVTDIAVFAVNEFIKGPENEKNAALISKDTQLLKLEIVDRVATVNFSKHYADEILLRQALVYTLCSIEGIDYVIIQVEGAPITDSNGKELGRLSMSDYTDPENAQMEAVKLYFPNGDGMLESEIREVDIQNITSLEKAVVTELINGPVSKSLTSSIPAGTKLLSIETTNDGVCTVNFSNEFTSSTSSSTLETTLRLYSVVNSLCELEHIESVKILINGEANVEMGDIVFDTTYDAIESYIK